MSKRVTPTEPEIPALKSALLMMWDIVYDLSASDVFEDRAVATDLQTGVVQAMMELDEVWLAWRKTPPTAEIRKQQRSQYEWHTPGAYHADRHARAPYGDNSASGVKFDTTSARSDASHAKEITP